MTPDPLVVPPGVITRVPINQLGQAQNVTLGTNSLIVGESGYYFIVAMIYGQNITKDAGLQLQFTINDAVQPFTYALNTIQFEFVYHTISTILALQEGDELALTFLSVSGLTFDFGASAPASMTIVKIADLPPV